MKVGLIGSGFMGKAHAFGFATAERVFDLPVSFEMDILADATLDLAEAARAASTAAISSAMPRLSPRSRLARHSRSGLLPLPFFAFFRPEWPPPLAAPCPCPCPCP